MGAKRTYNVEITEIKHFDIDIEAESEKEALTKARISYGNGAYKTQLRNTVAAEFEIINGK